MIGYYKNSSDNECELCSDTFKNCLECSESECTKCAGDFYLPSCESESCDEGYLDEEKKVC